MQNVLLQMGLNVVSLDGLRVRRLERFALRCYGCFRCAAHARDVPVPHVPPRRLVMDVEKVFCPRCGHNTLQKVSYVVDAAGQVVVRPLRRISTRGTRARLRLRPPVVAL
jgi:RNA-binding protein NOB1